MCAEICIDIIISKVVVVVMNAREWNRTTTNKLKGFKECYIQIQAVVTIISDVNNKLSWLKSEGLCQRGITSVIHYCPLL
jgi:hypothetical protein